MRTPAQRETLRKLAVLTIAVVSIAGCAASQPPGRDPSNPPRPTERYTDSAGWSLVYPHTMHLERSSSGPGMAKFTEVTVASFAQQRAVHTGRTRDGGFIRVNAPLNVSAKFPSDGVAFRMLIVDGGPGPAFTVADSRFPIELTTFRNGGYYRQPPGVPAPMERPVDADGQHYTAMAWIGRHATPQARASIERVISSPLFPPLRPGTLIADRLTVLQPAGRYSVGSFTLFHAQGLVCDGDPRGCRWSDRAPFYVLHAPGRLHEPDLLTPCTPAGS